MKTCRTKQNKTKRKRKIKEKKKINKRKKKKKDLQTASSGLANHNPETSQWRSQGPAGRSWWSLRYMQIKPHGRNRANGKCFSSSSCRSPLLCRHQWSILLQTLSPWLPGAEQLCSVAESVTKTLRNFVLRPWGSDHLHSAVCWWAGCGELDGKDCVCNSPCCSQSVGESPKCSKSHSAVLQEGIYTEAQPLSPLSAQLWVTAAGTTGTHAQVMGMPRWEAPLLPLSEELSLLKAHFQELL